MMEDMADEYQMLEELGSMCDGTGGAVAVLTTCRRFLRCRIQSH